MTCALVTPQTLPRFQELCALEHLFGSRCRCANIAGTAKSYLLDGPVPAALSLAQGVLTVVSYSMKDVGPLLEFVADHKEIVEIDSTLDLCTQLQEELGGTLESSFFMRCNTPTFPPKNPALSIVPSPAFPAVFTILQNSHPYYKENLHYDSWSAELERWLELGLSELYGLEVEGVLVGTGRILSHDDEAAAIGSIAVLPTYRNRGYGSQMSAFLTQRVIELGKVPVLISGYDEVASLYRSIGYCETGRWGELYLDR